LVHQTAKKKGWRQHFVLVFIAASNINNKDNNNGQANWQMSHLLPERPQPKKQKAKKKRKWVGPSDIGDRENRAITFVLLRT